MFIAFKATGVPSQYFLFLQLSVHLPLEKNDWLIFTSSWEVLQELSRFLQMLGSSSNGGKCKVDYSLEDDCGRVSGEESL